MATAITRRRRRSTARAPAPSYYYAPPPPGFLLRVLGVGLPALTAFSAAGSMHLAESFAICHTAGQFRYQPLKGRIQHHRFGDQPTSLPGGDRRIAGAARSSDGPVHPGSSRPGSGSGRALNSSLRLPPRRCPRHPVPGNSAAQRVEEHIKELHSQLRITPAENPQWDQFAAVMRENARDMDQVFAASACSNIRR